MSENSVAEAAERELAAARWQVTCGRASFPCYSVRAFPMVLDCQIGSNWLPHAKKQPTSRLIANLA